MGAGGVRRDDVCSVVGCVVHDPFCLDFSFVVWLPQLANALNDNDSAARRSALLSQLQQQYLEQFKVNSSSLCSDICGQASYSFSYQAVRIA